MTRSVHAIWSALIALLHERQFHDIRVQDILERSGVGRTTFYAHYRSKEDVLFSSFERLFDGLEPMLLRSGAPDRLFPVEELITHVRSSHKLLAALDASKLLSHAWQMCEAQAARIIERRIPVDGGLAGLPRRVLARALAASLVELLEWGIAKPDVISARRLDVVFHELAHRVLYSELSPDLARSRV